MLFAVVKLATACPTPPVALAVTKAGGKPEAAIEKIVEGRLNAWFKDNVLLEQGFVRDDKQTITQLLGDAKIAQFAQAYIGS